MLERKLMQSLLKDFLCFSAICFCVNPFLIYLLAPTKVSTLLGSHQILLGSLGSSFNNCELVLASSITSCFKNREYKEWKTCTSSQYTNGIIGFDDWNFQRHSSTKDATEEKNIKCGTVRGSLTVVFNVSTVFVPGSFFCSDQILLYAVINLNSTFANINIFNPPGLAKMFWEFWVGINNTEICSPCWWLLK